jgi:hypothetical protein
MLPLVKADDVRNKETTVTFSDPQQSTQDMEWLVLELDLGPGLA